MNLKTHLFTQLLMFGVTTGTMLTNTVPDKWKPVVVGFVSLCQIGLAYVAHHHTPDGQKL